MGASLSMRGLLSAVGAIVTAAGFNRQVSINDWLLTTSPLNPLSVRELQTLSLGLVAAFPGHAA